MTYQPLGNGLYRVSMPRSAITGRYNIPPKEDAASAMAKHRALIERVRAALRLLDNGDITPAGRRVIEKILDAEMV